MWGLSVIELPVGKREPAYERGLKLRRKSVKESDPSGLLAR